MYLCNLYTNIRFEVTFVHFLIVHIYVACVSYIVLTCVLLCLVIAGFPPKVTIMQNMKTFTETSKTWPCK